MPSTVRHNLLADLWSQSNNRTTSSSSGFSHHEMQACPGLYEDLKRRSPSQKMHKFQMVPRRLPSGNRNTKPLSCRGITDSLDDLALYERTTSDSSLCSSVDLPMLSQSSDSDSNVDYASEKVCDAFASDAESSAPAPNQLPLPPMQWLKPQSKSPLTVGRSLQTMMF